MQQPMLQVSVSCEDSAMVADLLSDVKHGYRHKSTASDELRALRAKGESCWTDAERARTRGQVSTLLR
jgi:hypothetical protein